MRVAVSPDAIAELPKQFKLVQKGDCGRIHTASHLNRAVWNVCCTEGIRQIFHAARVQIVKLESATEAAEAAGEDG